MRPKKHTAGSGDLFPARLDQILNMKHALIQLAGKVDWDWFDGEIAPLYSENGRPSIATRLMIGAAAAQAQLRRHQRQSCILRNRLGRIIRDIRRKIEGQSALESVFALPIGRATQIR